MKGIPIVQWGTFHLDEESANRKLAPGRIVGLSDK
jgi:hypothetical protein